MYQQFGGSFESIGTTLTIKGLGAKMGPKNQNLKQGDKASFLFHLIRFDELFILVYSFVKIG